MWSSLSSFFQAPPPAPSPVEDLPAAKIAILGAGMGGCFAARFLRENGGGKLDIHMWMKKGSKVGGRTATSEFAGHTYETGASIIHSRNKYLSESAKEFGLEIKGQTNPKVPLAIYDGSAFSIQFGTSKIYSLFQILWRYGLDLFRMNRSVGALLRDFSNIYSLQAEGLTFATVEDMLSAMGGREMYKMTQTVTGDFLLNTKQLNKTLVEEIVGGALRMNYGQALTVNAFTTFVSLAGMEDGSLWSVVGGNWQIAEKVLEASGAILVEDDVVSVRKVVDEDGNTTFSITVEDGTVSDGFDVVIVANPLNLSSIKYENFPSDFYTAAATTPYQRTVATFVCGKIRQEFFGASAPDPYFPQVVLTSAYMDAPFQFNSVAVQIPSEISQAEVADYSKPIGDDPQRVWKVFSPEPLTEEQLKLMFSDVESTQVHDWQAYPHYSPPEQIPPFVLDDGVYYINAIEKAASAMEMSAIGAKNAAQLARDYILEQNRS